MEIAQQIAKQINVKPSQSAAVIELLDEGNTIPFIARYRKERTGTLDEEQIRNISILLERLRALEERKATIIATIESQEKMTPELLEKIQQAETMTTLEDLYLPYKPKRKTRASIAREKGLDGLAEMILKQDLGKDPIDVVAQCYLSDMVPTIEDALAGARDIVAETIADNAEVRSSTREKALGWGLLHSEKIEGSQDDRKVYELYYEYDCRVDRLRPHQILAINRGEKEKILRVSVEVAERDWRNAMTDQFALDRRSYWFDEMKLAMEDSAERLLLPAIERDVRRKLSETAEAHAIRIFADNLRALLTQPPLAGHVVMGLDPAYRTGCKVAVVDSTGKMLTTETIYPHEPKKQWRESLKTLAGLAERYNVTLITIGNGTASRETEQLVAEFIKGTPGLQYLITNEAGASVYSASELARAELPDMDVSLRGAVSIARRVQDPLAELVKIDPKSIGVGMYQHDVNQTELSNALTGVVESVVNQVGVDLNTASPALLTFVSGIGPKLAEKVVAYRNEFGQFQNRTQLKEVSGLGQKAFEQAAGFLRIRGGKNPLDETAIHPESYSAAKELIKRSKLDLKATIQEKQLCVKNLVEKESLEKIAGDMSVGLPTLKDILEQLVRPGRDPREDLPTPILRSDVLSMEDLIVGMRLKGTVRNVVDFGAFVDIGVKQDGLIHRSQVPIGYSLNVGDVVDVEIVKIETERGRIGLKIAD
jgi:uncharacterized protein